METKFNIKQANRFVHIIVPWWQITLLRSAITPLSSIQIEPSRILIDLIKRFGITETTIKHFLNELLMIDSRTRWVRLDRECRTTFYTCLMLFKEVGVVSTAPFVGEFAVACAQCETIAH